MAKTSYSFVDAQSARDAFLEVRDEPGPVVLERSVGRGVDAQNRLVTIWAPTSATSMTAGVRLVKSLHGAPIPGKFRWKKGT